MVLRVLLTLCWAGWLSGLQAQVGPYDDIRPYHAALAGCEAGDCATASDALGAALEELVGRQDMESPATACDFMGFVASADGRLRVWTWNWANDNRTAGYGGLVAFSEGRGEAPRFTKLKDVDSADRPDEQAAVSAENWHGALYYAMVPDAIDKNTWLLLGWDDGDAQVTRKVIEPIQWRPRGLRFGAPVLQSPKGMKKRHVLEYADAVQASLRFQAETRGREGHPDRIIFDHLAPSAPHLEGITAFYGPDMTFDAYVPGKKGGAPWVLQLEAPAAVILEGDRPFSDPRQRNGRGNQR